MSDRDPRWMPDWELRRERDDARGYHAHKTQDDRERLRALEDECHPS